MPQRADVVLSDREREVLERWARRPKSAQALALRCRIVLAAADGEASKEIAARLGCNRSTVGRWRGRFAERGLDGLHDEPRPGKPRSISDDDVERVIVKTLEEQPPGATHWSTRSMAHATGMSQTAVSRMWRAFGLKPHQTEASSSRRPAMHRHGARHRRGLPQPARGRRRALRRREVTDPGARPHGCGPAAHAGVAERRAAHTTTSAPRRRTSPRRSTSPPVRSSPT
jgi:transposase